MIRPLIPVPIFLRSLFVLVCCFAAIVPALAADPAAVRSMDGMVVSPVALATLAGADVLAEGGTAADATVAVALVLAVTNPQAGSLGGGGFALIRDEDGKHTALDFRETAPANLTAAHFLDEEGRPIAGLSLETGLAVGVPGNLDGLLKIHERWGKLPWKRLVAPATRLADDGFPVYPHLAHAFEDAHKRLRQSDETRRVFFIEGRLPRNGETLRQPDLAVSLQRIAEHGRAGFYTGPVAEAVAGAVQARGGVMTTADLEAFRSVEREPVRGTYRGFEIVSFPPPSSGGVVLLQMLAMLERHEMSAGYGASRSIHLMTEIQRRAYADRSKWLGDPDHVDVPLESLLSADYLASRAKTIRFDRATPSSEVLPGKPRTDEHDTLHFSIADADGRAVAFTTTLNTNFGSGIVAPGTGILLNNEMDDFSLAPGVPNVYGLVGGEANAVRALKRPLSSMTPTIVEYPRKRERPALVLGSPGGGRIINSVFQVIVNVIDHEMHLQEAVNAPRTHHQWLPDRLYYEPRAVPVDVLRSLEALGHEVSRRQRIGNVNAISSDEQGAWLGAVDPRRGGLAAGPP